MGAGAGFGVVLDAEGGVGFAGDAFDGLVVEVDVRHLDVRRECVRLQGEAVVLAGDFNLAADLVEDGLVGAAVSEFEFVDLAAEG